MEYIRKKRASAQLNEQHAQASGANANSLPDHERPVLTEEDELFLHRITSEPEGTPPELPPRHPDTDVVSSPLASPTAIEGTHMNSAADVPLPQSPAPVEEGKGKRGDKGKEKEKHKEKGMNKLTAFFRRGSETRRKSLVADDLQSAAEGLKSPTKDGEGASADKENEELEAVMEQLNLAAVNNRVFSVSDESRELLRKFTLVLKDLVHGVPTAYNDLESLLTNSEGQLQKMFGSLPSWLQGLVTKLPNKVTEHLGPEFLAAAAEKQGLKSEYLTQGAAAAEKAGVKLRVPSLKELLAKQGAVAGLLRAIMDFLRTRFPAVLGVNVLWSLAISVLLLIFWYCFKRGREERLEKERALTEAEMEAVRQQVAAEPAADYVPPTTTTAPVGASIEEVRRGVEEVATARAAAIAGGSDAGEGSSTTGHGSQLALESSLYAPGGSLSQTLKKEEEQQAELAEARAGKRVENEIEHKSS